MTAKEKFEKRLVELGLMNDWKQQCGYGRVGKELEDGRIVIFVHEDGEDRYSEETFPPFNVLREDEKFQRECWTDFSVHDNDEFVKDLACWLRKYTDKCPLYPVDLYFVADHLSEGSVDFTDDPVEENPKVYEKWFGETLDNIVNRAESAILENKETIVTAIDYQFHQGCQIPDGFEPYPGWGSLTFMGYCFDSRMDTLKLFCTKDDVTALHIHHGICTETVPLGEVPVGVLVRIYRQMR